MLQFSAMHLRSLEIGGFKSFAKKTHLDFSASITAIVGPNGSGKSNVAEGFRFVLGEQSMKSMRGKKGEDLIWNGSPQVSRANRASVKLTFDNSKKFLDIDFDEVTLERVVHRDGVNEYLLNGSQVRLRDIVELLAKANIGASGHHIISQGEADRILSASTVERREMLEDALGLKSYLYKREESQKKLLKTAENIKEVQSLRREIAPHLRFLEKQVEKIERAEKLRLELRGALREYLKREDIYLTHAEERAREERERPERELVALEKELARTKAALAKTAGGDAKRTEVLEAEEAIEALREKRETLARELGRLEGELYFAERHAAQTSVDATAPLSMLRRIAEEGEREWASVSAEGDAGKVRSALRRVLDILKRFIEESSREGVPTALDTKEVTERRDAIAKELSAHMRDEERVRARYQALREEIEAVADESREAEREMFRIASREGELKAHLATIRAGAERLVLERAEWKRDLAEGAALVGREVLAYEQESVDREEALKENRKQQEDRKKAIERMKIRLEEMGGGASEEVMKEYTQVKERDEFLTREIADLEKSAEALGQLIEELTDKLAEEFKSGVKKINEEFTKFFALMFGGGTASLSLIKERRRKRFAGMEIDEDGEALVAPAEDEEVEEGIDIAISLPHKRIRGLQMLSGGERALTSIALIFAMSQVNPPPFLILDETDAALDEANSKRYGDMIENLAKRSQLILITHNRETMSRAGILYGVTMGSDGVSKLLSVKFEEAVAVAK